MKAAHNARCITCRGAIRQGEEVAVVGGFWRHPVCLALSAPSAVVPKVTADPITHALWALGQDDRARARELIGTLSASERRAYLAQLTELINMMWSET